MKFYRFSSLFVSAILLMGCVKTSQYRKVSQEEAFSFIQARERKSTTPPQESKPLYIQPVNKSEPCKLGTSQDQLDRNNFRAYWDGQCKDGFAYGLGRDIAISDTHHQEEITIYRDNGEMIDSPAVGYDFVHNMVVYRFVGNKQSTSTYFKETISKEQGDLNVSYDLGKVFDNGDANEVSWSPFNSIKYFLNYRGNVIYRLTKDENPKINTDPISVFETIDNNTGVAGGFAAAKFSNGQNMNYKLENGQVVEYVVLPQEYFSMIKMKYQEIEKAQMQASEDIEKAKRMEKEYLYLACNGKHQIQGLEREISNKICTWREQFQEPFKLAQKKYSENLEKMKIEARSQEEKQKLQKQLDYQKRMVHAAERQARAAEDANFNSLLKQYKTTTCYTNFGITTCY